IDLRNKRAKLQLLRELTRIEIANRTRLNFRRIDLRIVNRLFAGLNNDVPDRFAFLFQVAFKISAPAAENVNFVHNSVPLNIGWQTSSKSGPRRPSRGVQSFRG